MGSSFCQFARRRSFVRSFVRCSSFVRHFLPFVVRRSLVRLFVRRSLFVRCLFVRRSSFFVLRSSFFVVCALFVRCLFAVCSLLFVRRLSFVVCRSSFVVRRSLLFCPSSGVRRLSFVVVLSVARRSLVARWLLVGCSLLVVSSFAFNGLFVHVRAAVVAWLELELLGLVVCRCRIAKYPVAVVPRRLVVVFCSLPFLRVSSFSFAR